MSTWHSGQRPITLAILAMGGEGGGVLADWLVAVAEEAGWVGQNTSVAGVAQRTGATVYYVELFPPLDGVPAGGRPEPVLSLFPTPGEVDIVIASELMECGRAVQRGFSTPDRTTLIASTNRVYSIDERKALGDGRVDSTELLAAARRGSKRLVAADFMQLAEEARSVISASLFGAVAGSGALPFTREQFEDEIRRFGKAVEASLAAFSAGFEAAQDQAPQPQVEATNAPGDGFGANGALGSPSDGQGRRGRPVDISIGRRPVSPEEQKEAEERRRTGIAAKDPASLVGPALEMHAKAVLAFPAAARSMILHGLERTAVYQDVDYAERFLARVAQLAAVDRDASGEARLTREGARNLALWMCYQDTIQVALQKTRQRRLERVRAEARADRDQLIQVREFLHPQIDEITDTMPTRLGARLRRSKTFEKVVYKTTHKGMVLNTTSVTGYTMLSTMARMRPLRPRSLRFVREQEAIEAWLDLILAVAPEDYDLACEIVDCQRVLKGYGATHEHGSDSFAKLMDAARTLRGNPDAAERLAKLRSAALADEDGTALAQELTSLTLV